MPSELHHEVAGETVGALDDDCARAIGHQPLEHLREAWAIVRGVRAAHRRVMERGDDL
jgi:hypothetical protein